MRRADANKVLIYSEVDKTFKCFIILLPLWLLLLIAGFANLWYDIVIP